MVSDGASTPRLVKNHSFTAGLSVVILFGLPCWMSLWGPSKEEEVFAESVTLSKTEAKTDEIIE